MTSDSLDEKLLNSILNNVEEANSTGHHYRALDT